MNRPLIWLAGALLAIGNTAFGADRNFSVPLGDLKKWSEAVVVELEGVTVKGASNIHGVKSDCEMHFGATVDGYKGNPEGWVLEPMNVCREPFSPGWPYSAAEWTGFAKSLRNERVVAYGVPRIWPEHLVGGEGPSNPNHAMELHPLTKLVVQGKTYDFTSLIYAPEGFPGGVSVATAYKILKELEVRVTTNGEDVEIEFDAGRIGNFTTLDIRLDRDLLDAAPAGHIMRAKVIADSKAKVYYPVSVVTVAGTRIDKDVAALKTRKHRYSRIEGLVLFSLDPVRLYDAAKSSHGQPVQVKEPIRLILYGKSED